MPTADGLRAQQEAQAEQGGRTGKQTSTEGVDIPILDGDNHGAYRPSNK